MENSFPYLFVRSSNEPAYQINSDGRLWQFANGDYRKPADEVMVSVAEIRSLLNWAAEKDALWLKCHELFYKRKLEKKRKAIFLTASEEFGLGLLLKEAWRALHQ